MCSRTMWMVPWVCCSFGWMIQSDYVPFSFLNLVLRVGLTQMKLSKEQGVEMLCSRPTSCRSRRPAWSPGGGAIFDPFHHAMQGVFCISHRTSHRHNARICIYAFVITWQLRLIHDLYRNDSTLIYYAHDKLISMIVRCVKHGYKHIWCYPTF